jgi:ethanolamine utilization protein EutA
MPHDAPWEHYHGPPDQIGGAGEVIVWTTVGFDIGSSTSQLAFSRVTLARRESHYVVAERGLLYESPVILTPYASPEVIDGRALAGFVEAQYEAAGLTRDQVDTGAVILTGLALSTVNSRAIAEAIADDGGKFVAVSAGDLLEARLAANGAGAPALSAGIDGVLVHIDIGGGTTKLSAWRGGKRLGLAAIDVGARLVTTDAGGRVRRVEPAAAKVREDLGLDLHEGEPLKPEVAERLAGALARNVLRYAGVLREPPRGQSQLRTEPLFSPHAPAPVAAVVFSGGVSEYIYGRESRTFGDLGPLLGRQIRAEVEKSGVRLLPLERGIRATVTGVSQHSVQLSGVTVFVSDEAALPLRNLPIIAPPLDLSAEHLDSGSIRAGLERAMTAFTGSDRAPAVGIAWNGSATYGRLGAVAQAVAGALEPRLKPGEPCVAVVQGDVAGVLGARLRELVGEDHPVVCLDGVHVHELDHLDIGGIEPATRALPVVVKSLLFSKP